MFRKEFNWYGHTSHLGDPSCSSLMVSPSVWHLSIYPTFFSFPFISLLHLIWVCWFLWLILPDGTTMGYPWVWAVSEQIRHIYRKIAWSVIMVTAYLELGTWKKRKKCQHPSVCSVPRIIVFLLLFSSYFHYPHLRKRRQCQESPPAQGEWISYSRRTHSSPALLHPHSRQDSHPYVKLSVPSFVYVSGGLMKHVSRVMFRKAHLRMRMRKGAGGEKSLEFWSWFPFPCFSLASNVLSSLHQIVKCPLLNCNNCQFILSHSSQSIRNLFYPQIRAPTAHTKLYYPAVTFVFLAGGSYLWNVMFMIVSLVTFQTCHINSRQLRKTEVRDELVKKMGLSLSISLREMEEKKTPQ